MEKDTGMNNSNIISNAEELLGGRYKLVKILGKGGMSTVYLAENINLGTFWAIKKVEKNTNAANLLRVESNILKKLNHPALPRIIDIIEDENCVYIIQDYIEGNSLDNELKNIKKFPEKVILKWAKQICDVLIYLHSFKPNPIIYRDMKPSNIILTPWGDIKLVDFGIAREYKEGAKSDTVYIGTKGYAAPEQYGGGQSNVATDVYSFGVTLYHLVTGKGPDKFPFALNSSLSYEENISHEIMQIIYKCTRFNPQERYQSIVELKKDIEAVERLKESENNIGTISSQDIMTASKRLALTVWDNAEFACELAYITAKLSKLDVLLVDLDLLSPKVDLYLNINKYPDKLIHEGISNESGINIVLDSIEKGCFTRESLLGACVKRNELGNLHILTGNYRLENYEYYTDESLAVFIDKAKSMFDVLLLAVGKSIYDSFTVISLIKSDLNIIPINATIDKFREFNNYLVFLKEKQKIQINKNKFIAYEYEPIYGLEEDAIDEITQHNYLGKVRYCQKRLKYRNLRLSYARKMDADVADDYLRILKELKILPKEFHIKPLFPSMRKKQEGKLALFIW